MESTKFKLKKGKGGVSGYTDEQGVTHLPGEIVDLPASMKGEKWLQPVEPEKKAKSAPSKIEPVEPVAGVIIDATPEGTAETPLPEKKSKKTK